MEASETPALTPADEQQLAKVSQEVAEARARAEAVTVTNDDEAKVAAEILADIAAKKKEAEAARKFLVGPLNAHVKQINARFKEATAPLDEGDQIVRGTLETYLAEQERRRQEEEARLRREAEERAARERAEREKAEREARERREEAERLARETEERARRDAHDRNAQAAAESAAAALDDAKLEEEEVDAEPPAPVAAPVVPAAGPIRTATGGGVSTRKVWTFEIEDEAAVPALYKKIDEPAIRRAVQGGTREIPGVRIFQKASVAVRGGS